MERDLWMAGLMKEYRKLPLDPNTILFIEDFSCGAAGVVSKLFADALKDPAYKDYRLVWTSRDYESVLGQFGELIEDERVWIVNRGMPDFIRFLAVAGQIYCANTLPNYYIKRAEQKIYTSFQLSLFISGIYTKNQIKNFVRTLNDTDYFLCREDGYDDSVLRKDYGVSVDRIKYIPASVASGNRNKVIIAINRDKSLTSSCAAFAEFVKRVEAVAGFYDKSVCSFVGLAFWKKYREQKSYFGIENVFCDEMDITAHYDETCLLITDSILRAMQAQRLNIPVIHWRGKVIPEHLEAFFGTLSRASNYTMIYKTFEELFGGLGDKGEYLYLSESDFDDEDDIEEDTGRYDEATQDGDTGSGSEGADKKAVSSLETAGDEDPEDSFENSDIHADAAEKELFCRRESFPSKNGEKYLYLLRWDKDPEYPGLVGRWLDDIDDGSRDITLMFLNSGDTALYSNLSYFGKPHKVTCRVGFYQSDPYERSLIVDKNEEINDYLDNVSHEFIDNEWKRLLGNVRFDHIIADSTSIFFWKAMYRYPPTDDFTVMTKKEKKQMLDKYIEEEVTK